MRFPQPYTLEQIATIINAKYVGASDFLVLGMNEIHVVQAGDIVFVDHPKYYEKALTLVDIQDNSAIRHIDTITVKPGKESEIKQLIREMDQAGLLTQTSEKNGEISR